MSKNNGNDEVSFIKRCIITHSSSCIVEKRNEVLHVEQVHIVFTRVILLIFFAFPEHLYFENISIANMIFDSNDCIFRLSQ